jgi:hypothetical protein
MQLDDLFIEYITNRDFASIKKHYDLSDYDINNCYAFCLGFAKKNQDQIKSEIHLKNAKQYEVDLQNHRDLVKLANRTKSYHLQSYLQGTQPDSELRTEIAKDMYNSLFKIDKQYLVKERNIKNIEFMRKQAFHIGYCIRNNIEVKNNFSLNMQKKLEIDAKMLKEGTVNKQRKTYAKLYLGIIKKPIY